MRFSASSFFTWFGAISALLKRGPCHTPRNSQVSQLVASAASLSCFIFWTCAKRAQSSFSFFILMSSNLRCILATCSACSWLAFSWAAAAAATAITSSSCFWNWSLCGAKRTLSSFAERRCSSCSGKRFFFCSGRLTCCVECRALPGQGVWP